MRAASFFAVPPAALENPPIRVLRRPSELAERGLPVSIALGFFDGVHLGHQAVLARCAADARESGGTSAVVTFDRHPSSVLAPEQAPPLVYPLGKRLQVLRECGMEAALLIHFDAAFSRVGARDFITELSNGFGRLASVSVGANFAFGHKRSGDLQLLREMAGPLDFRARAVEPVVVEGSVVSSTRARDAIREGRFDLARALLGRPYSLSGRVVPGDQIGRRIGFPTANLDVSGLVTPPPGVYAARAGSGSDWHPAAVNIGHRPTVVCTGAPLRVEAHLLDFAGDLVGSGLELVFLARVRDEIKFPGLEALQARIRDDIAFVRKFF